MLVLSRKKNESIVINGEIHIEVLQIKGKQIRLGITAPNNMKILRGELPKLDVEVNQSRKDATLNLPTGQSESRNSEPANCNPGELSAKLSNPIAGSVFAVQSV